MLLLSVRLASLSVLPSALSHTPFCLYSTALEKTYEPGAVLLSEYNKGCFLGKREHLIRSVWNQCSQHCATYEWEALIMALKSLVGRKKALSFQAVNLCFREHFPLSLLAYSTTSDQPHLCFVFAK